MARKRQCDAAEGATRKKSKSIKSWRSRSERPGFSSSSSGIEPGVAGIWVTCDRGKESRCVSELHEFFNEYATKAYDSHGALDAEVALKTTSSIEAEIASEVQDLKAMLSGHFLHPLKTDTQCVLFFQSQEPVQPAELVRRICTDAWNGSSPGIVRYVKRLTPVTRTGRATESGIDEVSKTVLAPHFQGNEDESIKFAIRITIRNHNVLKRDDVIKRVADAVGAQHQVDLDHPKLQVLVDIHQNVCGMAVVDESYNRLKRYNIAEIYKCRPRS